MKSQTNGIGLNPKQKVPVSELLEGNQDLDELDLKKQFSLGTSSCRSAVGSEQSDKESNQQMISRNKTILDVDSFQQFLNDSGENYSQQFKVHNMEICGNPLLYSDSRNLLTEAIRRPRPRLEPHGQRIPGAGSASSRRNRSRGDILQAIENISGISSSSRN